MSMVVKCDLCKETIDEDMDTYEVKKGRAGSGVKEAYAAHICPPCAKALGVAAFIHKFKSMGGIDLVQKAHQAQMEEQRATAIAGPNAPVPVDPALLAKLQGR